MLKSIAVVVGSYILSVALVIGTEPLLMKMFPGDYAKGHIPSNTALMASTTCFIVISILCAWVCARFAPSNAAKHVLWFFVIGEVMGIAMTVPNWNNGWPHWYWLSWILSWPVSCWIGLMISGRKSEEASTASA